MKKKEKIILIVFIAISLLGFLFYTTSKNLSGKNAPAVGNTQTATAILEIADQKYEQAIQPTESVYDFMDQLRQAGRINFMAKNYAGMGEFIDSINGTKNNQNKSWIYYINKQKASVGVSGYQLKSGDIVSWKYEQNY